MRSTFQLLLKFSHEKPDSDSLTTWFWGVQQAAFCFGCGYILTYFVATRNDVLNFKSHGVCYIIHSFLEHEEMEWETSGLLKRHAKTRKTWIFQLCESMPERFQIENKQIAFNAKAKRDMNLVSNALEHSDRILL